MIRHLVSMLVALLLVLGIHLAAQAEVIGTHSNATHTILLHNVQGPCGEGLFQAQIVETKTKVVTVLGCWAEFNDMVGILWEGSAAPNVGPSKLFHWMRS